METAMILMQAAQGGGGMSFIIMMVVIFAIMWFFMIRPQQKKQKELQKELQNFRKSIGVGSQVVTAGGVYGTVKQVVDEDNTLIVEIDKDVKVKIDRNSVFASAPQQPGK